MNDAKGIEEQPGPVGLPRQSSSGIDSSGSSPGKCRCFWWIKDWVLPVKAEDQDKIDAAQVFTKWPKVDETTKTGS